jgi:hypothetical protein
MVIIISEDNETEKEFYENVAKLTNTVNQRSMAPEGTNKTVDPEEGEPTSVAQMDLDQDDNYFPL